MQEIRGIERTIRGLLGKTKYQVDYYQREYRWGEKHVTELVEDLISAFEESYLPGHKRADIKAYDRYFLGPIIISKPDEDRFIVDGQQRLTSLTLLLIALLHRIEDSEQQGEIRDLIFSMRYGERSFNIQVDERHACMDALYRGYAYDPSSDGESVRTVVARYDDIVAMTDELSDDAILFFSDWLIDHVYLVEITATSNRDAFTIFETMNDRGLSLSPTEMLKGFLLSRIGDEQRRSDANDLWRSRTDKLTAIGRSEDADAIRAWLRSQHATTGTGKSGEGDDFERIGNEFHRWVGEHVKELELTGSAEFADFVEKNACFYIDQYLKLREAAQNITLGLEAVKYLADLSFTLQYPALLAPLAVEDTEPVRERKWRVVGAYLDIMLHRRIWTGKAITQSAMRGTIYDVIRDIRRASVDQLAERLTTRLEQQSETFQSSSLFALHGRNRKHVRAVLARFADYVESQSDSTGRYAEYMKTGSAGYDIEHILPEQFVGQETDFDSEIEYRSARDRIGALVLLQRSKNRSVQDQPYSEKLNVYATQNILAQSLHPLAYESNPAFKRFIDRVGLDFRPMRQFGRPEVEKRQRLAVALAGEVWHPRRIQEEAAK